MDVKVGDITITMPESQDRIEQMSCEVSSIVPGWLMLDDGGMVNVRYVTGIEFRQTDADRGYGALVAHVTRDAAIDGGDGLLYERVIVKGDIDYIIWVREKLYDSLGGFSTGEMYGWSDKREER